ncbi:MAG: putative deacylase [Colwellia polaris]|jgi:succinylglutamate desuccinylase
MKAEIIGEGKPEVAVVGLVHGDEACGLRAIRRFKEEVKNGNYSLEKSVKLVLANEKAFNQGKRYVDKDLNRSFPGSHESDQYEERLAARLRGELEGLKVLDLHASESPKTPFAIISGMEKGGIEVAETTCMENLVEISFVKGSLIDDLDAAVVECGFHNEQESAEVAYNVTVNFLAAHDVIEQKHDTVQPEIYKVTGKEEGEKFEFVAENFAPVEKGEIYAKKSGEERKAEEKFWPILMSTNGYNEMIGFRGQKVEKEL